LEHPRYRLVRTTAANRLVVTDNTQGQRTIPVKIHYIAENARADKASNR
jgi:hypothetical protein